MRRIHDQHGMELESDGSRLHVLDAGQEQRGYDLAIARSRVDFLRDFLQ